MALVVKNPPVNAGDAGDAASVPGLERIPGGENDNPLQYPCLENPKDRGVWGTTVHGVAKSRTPLSDKAQVPPVPMLLGWEPHFENHCL